MRTGIKLHLQGIVVLPGDVQTARLTDDSADPERLALKPRGIVLRQIPRVRNA